MPRNTSPRTPSSPARDSRAYHALLEAQPQPVILWDRKTYAILEVNIAAVKHYGYSRQQLKSMTIMDIRTSDRAPKVMRGLTRRRRAIKEARFIHRKRGGEVFEAAVNTHWVNYQGRKAALAFVRDVTAHKAVERDLRDNEQRLRHLVDAVKDYAIFMLDPDGIVTSWNEGARRLKGYRSEEIIGRHFSVFYTAADANRGLPRRLLRKALSQGRAEDRGWRVRKDGSRFHADVVITPIKDEAGRLRGFAKVTRDTTAGDEAVAAVTLSRGIVRAEEAERRRVARELHDGVNQILAAAKFRYQDAEERLPPSHDARAALVEARIMLESAIQELRRISHNLRPIILDEFGLKTALRGACASFRRSAGLSVRLATSRLPESLSEEIELTVYRIVQEALNNVAHHANARRVSVVVLRRGMEIHLTVRDDGKGLTSGGEGSGLNNIRERAQFLGGRCELSSARGRGTTIRVALPERS